MNSLARGLEKGPVGDGFHHLLQGAAEAAAAQRGRCRDELLKDGIRLPPTMPSQCGSGLL